MSGHNKRGRIEVLPLNSIHRRWRHHTLSANRPLGCSVEALTMDGLLVRFNHTGSLAIWQGDRLVSVDERKAEAALLLHNEQPR